MTKILTIYTNIRQIIKIKGKNGEAKMILFDGRSESEFFRGTVCSGGVDTQKQEIGKVMTLSARYVLEGKDYTGRGCRIFIENNAEITGKNFMTKPEIYTDSDALSFLEKAELSGTLTPYKDGVVVHIYCSDKDVPAINKSKRSGI